MTGSEPASVVAARQLAEEAQLRPARRPVRRMPRTATPPVEAPAEAEPVR